MFTLVQINEIHERLGNQSSLPEYLQALSSIGVEKYDSFISDGHAEYFGKDNQKVVSPPEHPELTVAQISNQEEFLKQLSLHSEGKTDYVEMSERLADCGIEKWSFDTTKMTIIYYNMAGQEMLVEAIE